LGRGNLKMITWITDNIAIGEYTDACNRELIKKEEIDCVLSLRIIDDKGEPLMLMQMGVEYYKIPVGRHQGLEPIKIELRTAAYMLEQLTEKYKRILVHCTAGMDRAPFVVAYWLVEYYDLSIDISMGKWDFKKFEEGKLDFKWWMNRAYEFIKEKRPQIIEHYEWI